VLNLHKALDMGRPVLTACASCYARLRAANYAIRHDAEERMRAERVTRRSYDGSVDVRHLVDVLTNDLGVDAIRRAVQAPLEGLSIACYYGCLLSRPPKIVAFDDPEHPQCMEEIIAALGARPVAWPFRTECCGAALSMTDPGVVNRLGHRLLSMARDAGADCLAVACPLCHMNLDLRQSDAVKAFGGPGPTPVLYITQLIGLALGLSHRELGLGALTVNVSPLLARIGARGAASKSVKEVT